MKVHRMSIQTLPIRVPVRLCQMSIQTLKVTFMFLWQNYDTVPNESYHFWAVLLHKFGCSLVDSVLFFILFAENSQIHSQNDDHYERDQRSRSSSCSSQGSPQEHQVDQRSHREHHPSCQGCHSIFNKSIKHEIERLKDQLRKKKENKRDCVETRLRLKKICRVPKDSKGNYKLPHFPLSFTN